jgi:hypothetical protein
MQLDCEASHRYITTWGCVRLLLPVDKSVAYASVNSLQLTSQLQGLRIRLVIVVVHADGVRLSLNCGRQRVYNSSPKVIFDYEEPRWDILLSRSRLYHYSVGGAWWHLGGIILTGKHRRTRRKNSSSATFPTTDPTLTGPGLNPGLRGQRPATNRVSHKMWLTFGNCLSVLWVYYWSTSFVTKELKFPPINLTDPFKLWLFSEMKGSLEGTQCQWEIAQRTAIFQWRKFLICCKNGCTSLMTCKICRLNGVKQTMSLSFPITYFF